MPISDAYAMSGTWFVAGVFITLVAVWLTLYATNKAHGLGKKSKTTRAAKEDAVQCLAGQLQASSELRDCFSKMNLQVATSGDSWRWIPSNNQGFPKLVARKKAGKVSLDATDTNDFGLSIPEDAAFSMWCDWLACQADEPTHKILKHLLPATASAVSASKEELSKFLEHLEGTCGGDGS